MFVVVWCLVGWHGLDNAQRLQEILSCCIRWIDNGVNVFLHWSKTHASPSKLVNWRLKVDALRNHRLSPLMDYACQGQLRA
eukprot:1158731-Pelagomonas_calceolata.AAC.5